MNWKIGQKLVCIGHRGGNKYVSGPDINEVVTISSFKDDKLGVPHVGLVEYPISLRGWIQYFKTENFRPLLGDSARTELISSFVEVTETSDCPINVPQTETICS